MDGCFPPGTARLTASLELAEQMESGPVFDLVYEVAFDDAGGLSIAVEGPVGPAD